MLIVGYVILFTFKAIVPVFIGSLLMMAGYLCGMAIFAAEIRENIPQNRAGQFQGVRIISQVFIPGLIGPFISARVLKNAEMIINSDGTSSFLPNQNIWLAALIVIVILAVVLIYIEKRKKIKA